MRTRDRQGSQRSEGRGDRELRAILPLCCTSTVCDRLASACNGLYRIFRGYIFFFWRCLHTGVSTRGTMARRSSFRLRSELWRTSRFQKATADRLLGSYGGRFAEGKEFQQSGGACARTSVQSARGGPAMWVAANTLAPHKVENR